MEKLFITGTILFRLSTSVVSCKRDSREVEFPLIKPSSDFVFLLIKTFLKWLSLFPFLSFKKWQCPLL